MKFTLKEYQADAAADVLDRLAEARKLHHGKEPTPSSVSLSATTGAGKTVIATAVIEALFWGSEQFEAEPDPGAVVIWFSDDPNLNEQTKDRIRQASEKFSYQQLVTIQHPFAQAKLEPHKVYFLNTGKLTKNSLLTRGHVDGEGVLPTMTAAANPDLQGWTIWETIANTIDDDDLTLYLILDEAHQGFNVKQTSDKPTIVRRLVNGHAGYPPVPVVWGISATIQRFEAAMQAAEAAADRAALDPVHIEPSRVQESGLVKDTIVLDIPNEAGNFDSVLVKRAARKLKESTERWHAYFAAEGMPNPVSPLLVLQSPAMPDHDQIGMALDLIADGIGELPGDAVRHVFGDHAEQEFGAWKVDWIEPQRVETTTHVRVLVAKDAVSTGWDCPRAEVLVSFRPAKDQTHITQLLGRMVRNPLARRIPGDERLNAVDCILPFFDRTTAGKVAKFLSGAIDELPGGGGKKILLDGRELLPNAAIGDDVWKCWDALPTQTLPKRGARPVKRLVALGQALAVDGLQPGAIAQVESDMHHVLDTLAARHKDEMDDAVKEILEVHGMTLTTNVGAGGITYDLFVEHADDRAILVGFDDAKKAFGADVAQSYVNHVAGDDDDDGLREAYVKVAALATVPAIRAKVDKEATEYADKWLAKYRAEILRLSDERQQAIEEIRALTVNPQRGQLMRPRTRLEEFAVISEDGEQIDSPMVKLHLMADEKGRFPTASLNKWERKVLKAEMARSTFRAWYRNPPRATGDSIAVAYRDRFGNWRTMHPDFVVFDEVDGKIFASIVDPHGLHLEDATLKLGALATFAKRFGGEFERIEALAEIGGKMRRLNLQRADVRAAIELAVVDVRNNKAKSEAAATALYKSDLADDYELATS